MCKNLLTMMHASIMVAWNRALILWESPLSENLACICQDIALRMLHRLLMIKFFTPNQMTHCIGRFIERKLKKASTFDRIIAEVIITILSGSSFM